VNQTNRDKLKFEIFEKQFATGIRKLLAVFYYIFAVDLHTHTQDLFPPYRSIWKSFDNTKGFSNPI